MPFPFPFLYVVLAMLPLPSVVADLLWRRVPVVWLALPYISVAATGVGTFQILGAAVLFAMGMAIWRLGGMGWGDAAAIPWVFIVPDPEISVAAFAVMVALALALARKGAHPGVAYFGIAYAVAMLALAAH